MARRYLVGSYSFTSRRHAILVDDGCTGIVYLHAPSDDSRTTGPVDGTSFAFNRVEPIPPEDAGSYQPGPPPIAKGYASDVAVCRRPGTVKWALVWSMDGEAVTLLRGGKPWAMVSVAENWGLSKAVGKRGPWGKPWSDEEYETYEWNGRAKRFT